MEEKTNGATRSTRRAKRVEIAPETFIMAWQAAESSDELMQRFGLTRHGLYSRAVYYRRKGVQLKRFPRRKRKASDWSMLRDLAIKCLPPETNL
jgi:hypothetical protein